MDTTNTVRRSVEMVIRPAMLAVAVVVLLMAFGAGGFRAERAGAQPVLTVEGFCEPDPAPPNVVGLVTCTTRISNTGDETATNLESTLGLSSACKMPSRFFLIDQTVDGELRPVSPLIGDLAPGETREAVTRLAAVHFGTGPTGASVTIVSLDDPSVTTSGDLCVNVTEDAEAPPANLQVTKTLLTELVLPEPEPFPEPPPPPEDGGPVPIEVAPAPPNLANPEQAEFEIVVSNVSDLEMTEVTILDVQTGDAVLFAAEPPVGGTDLLGRPTWDVGALAPGEEFRILATYGPPPEGQCSYADDVVVVTATPAGGEQENYAAFAEFGISVGPCDFGPPDLCWFYPPNDGEPIMAACSDEVWWSAPPGSEDYQPIFNPHPDTEYCWFIPPGQGWPELSPCDEPLFWLSFSTGEDEFFYPVRPGIELCEFTAPDGSTSIRQECAFPVCWSTPPEGGSWEPIFGCGEFEELCWFSPPGDGDQSLLSSCAFPPRFAINPPEGAVDFGFGPGPVLYFDEDACWPIPPDGGEFFTFPVPCSEIEFITWFTPSDGGPAFFNFGEREACWQPSPPDIEPPSAELPPDLLVPGPCAEGEEGKTGVPGSSVPAEVVEGVSTQVEIVEGTVERIDPLPSAEVTPAELIRTEQIEPAPPDVTQPGDDELAVPLVPIDEEESPTQADMPDQSPAAAALPDSGTGFSGGDSSDQAWAFVLGLTVGGLLCTAAAIGLRRQRGL